MKYYPPFFFLFLFFRIQDNKIKIEELAHFLANRRIPLSFHIPAENDHIIMGQFKISWKAMTLPWFGHALSPSKVKCITSTVEIMVAHSNLTHFFPEFVLVTQMHVDTEDLRAQTGHSNGIANITIYKQKVPWFGCDTTSDVHCTSCKKPCHVFRRTRCSQFGQGRVVDATALRAASANFGPPKAVRLWPPEGSWRHIHHSNTSET